MDTFVGVRAFKTGIWTLALYTIVLATLAVARGSENTPGFGQRVLLVALSGFLVGFFLDSLVRAVHGSAWKRFRILAFLIFALACVSNAIETVLYLPAVAVAGSIAGGIIQTVILAVVLVRVTQPAPNHEASGSLRFLPRSWSRSHPVSGSRMDTRLFPLCYPGYAGSPLVGARQRRCLRASTSHDNGRARACARFPTCRDTDGDRFACSWKMA